MDRCKTQEIEDIPFQHKETTNTGIIYELTLNQLNYNSFETSEPANFRGSPNIFFNEILFFNSSKPVLTEKSFVD